MDAQSPQLISEFITEVGLPVSLLLGSVGVIYFLIRYVLGQIITTMKNQHEEMRQDIHDLGKANKENHNRLYDITVQLIKRVHRMENSVIRLDSAWRISRGLAIEEKNIGQVGEEE